MGLDSEVRVFRGPDGRGNIRFNKAVVKIVADDGNIYEIANDNVTAELPTNHKKVLSGVYFQLNPDETELSTVRPYKGTHVVEFGGFTRRGEENELGTYMKKRPAGENKETGQKWPARPDEERFTAVLDVVAGEWKGYSYIYWLPYIFTKKQGSQVARLYGTQNRVDRLEKFLEFCGIERDGPSLDITIPWQPDQGVVLEFLEDTLNPLAKTNRFQVITDRGWPLNKGEALTGMASGTVVA